MLMKIVAKILVKMLVDVEMLDDVKMLVVMEMLADVKMLPEM